MSDATVSTPIKIEDINRKQYFTGKVIKTTLAGAIVDIGLEIPGVIHISQLQKEPVKRVEDVVQAGQTVEVWVRRVYPKKNRIELTMIKPLDLEWNEIEKDSVHKGKVSRLERFGVFVDIGAERPGLVHISELTHDYIRNPGEVVKEGDEVEVKVLDVDRRKRQIRLSMKALEEKPEKITKVIQSKIEKKEKTAEVTPAEQKDLPVPTAMEMAMRQAMEKIETTTTETPAKKKPRHSKGNELEDILKRTLKHKVSTR